MLHVPQLIYLSLILALPAQGGVNLREANLYIDDNDMNVNLQERGETEAKCYRNLIVDVLSNNMVLLPAVTPPLNLPEGCAASINDNIVLGDEMSQKGLFLSQLQMSLFLDSVEVAPHGVEPARITFSFLYQGREFQGQAKVMSYRVSVGAKKEEWGCFLSFARDRKAMKRYSRIVKKHPSGSDYQRGKGPKVPRCPLNPAAREAIGNNFPVIKIQGVEGEFSGYWREDCGF